MARQGSEKRRTGCVTCKRRKVKCDEARPVCNRCHVGGRSCTYLSPPIGSYSWQHLLQAKPPLLAVPGPGLPQQEARSLDYFRSVVAPVLDGSLGNGFWTNPVMQLAMNEAAVMHGIHAISLLYEGFEPSWKDSLCEEEVLRHYNHALRLVATSKPQEFAVLVASVLFICIEFLRGNTAAAITHCRHGILLARTCRAPDSAAADVLQHLSIFPHFFSSGEFPSLSSRPQESRFESLAAAATAMDKLLAQAIGLVRSLDAYRLGADDLIIPPDVWNMQQAVLRDLMVWKIAFEALPVDTAAADTARSLLRMRFLVGWVWTSIAPHREETASDWFHAEFAEIVRLAKIIHQQASTTKFTFSMGTAPLLHFAVIKCRHLATRLEALKVLRDLANVRESLWDAETMYAIGKCIVEHEHGILVDEGLPMTDAELPDDRSRIRDSYVEDEVFEHLDEQGNLVFRRRIHLVYLEGSAVAEKLDWISSSVITNAE
ncbi:C6 zinc finger domain-containing protein [Microdochium trichocladiopsis]|uniref:C6 zinc finger domain-containing protein n=1 Tax=Microdochium trichocladiopsis TaxID=1682393 RepID=A0A9P8XZS5_9PEZI|nr:C6 zinc finger domain-containing protein [Microdochium trichocladiopsis]KAH7026730.1 C6 zinc finger domain-containing protein [Microdochium trichocladiopsis]